MNLKPLLITLLITTKCFAQIPAGYYNAAAGIYGGVNLKMALHNCIKNQTALGYPALWNAFYTTDVKPNGKLWDIYSYKFTGPQPYEFTLGTNQCGQYSQEGDCYNREHTWPQTFFNSADPMVSDLNHIFPTDGTVNGIHSNDPYGNVTTAVKTTLQGCKSGTGTSYTGYNNNIFEPIDSFKGDIARAYFYMNARYTTEDAGWGNWTMANGAELTADAIKVLLAWHHLDPVSQKEIDRNNAIYNLQGNRNPFIDFPQYADCIWGTGDCSAMDIIDKIKYNFEIIQSNNEIIIENNSTPLHYQLFNINGQLIQNQITTNHSISTQNLVQGIYCLKIFDATHIQNFRFIK